ncbi:selenium-dependent xanthine dehydrogenase [Tepidibacter aestuarii]|uniref:selenium-dependent xanthine dehydrogenase n=1 Tax=Tepidibacter aestuarii TaxID=2925782 RepID=UPI0020BD7B19|nr:selenium-dependent xanthine dehydrogenase [Tepidibacter aestuarii]CAH2213746.1 aldehyde oxidoreductase [Tepidibacter aestuarii]
MYGFIVNGKSVNTKEDKSLLEYLREDLGLISVKDGCSEGTCGTCTILVDGKKIKSCILKTSKVVGKEITTVEGLSDKERDVYTFVFAEAGAVQCGFCIPGMVISAKSLLDNNLNPTEEEIKKAIKGNVCRCTGYIKIVKAIQMAAKLFREKTEVLKIECKGFVGEKMHRTDAKNKVLGTGQYVDDMYINEMLYGSAVRSKYPRALVKKIDTLDAKKHPGVVAVLTAKDIPGKRYIGHLVKDWPAMIEEGEETKYVGDAIALVAATSKKALKEGLNLVKVEYEELEPLTSPEMAMKKGAPKIHKNGNILRKEVLKRGNANEAIENSKYVVTSKYSTPFTEHAFLEPECAIGMPDGEDGILLYTGAQGIYDEQREVSELLSIPKEKVRVISKLVGGAFGGKEDMSVQHHAALLAWNTKKPVKVKLSRKESIMIHPKRHAMEMEFTTACDENGKLTAMKAEIIADTGAYTSLGGPVLQRACTHAAGPYNYQNVDIEGIAVYTNNPPGGAFRGFGVTQSAFATESNLNFLAKKVGISSWEIRYRNSIRPGEILPNGQVADEGTAMEETLLAVKEEYEKHPYTGIACAFKNSGLGVGVPDIGRCRLTVLGGKVYIRTSAACMGQGLATVTTQIVCETTKLSPNLVVADAPDTAKTPNSGTSTASRQTLFTGEATRRAALKLKELLDTGKTLIDLEEQDFYAEYEGITDPMGSHKPNPVSHIAYGYATHVVVLDDNGKLQKVIGAHDIGKAINPINVEGQIEGGVVMGLGYALTEDYPLNKGVPTAKFGTLGLFRVTEVPKIKSIIVEKNQSPLAYGAKGIGEIATIPTAPAVQGAYYELDGKHRTKLPLEDTPYSRKK